MEITELILELWSNYGIATDRFFHLRLPAPRPRRRRTPAKPPGRPTHHASSQNCSRAPGFAPNQLSWRSPELDTRPRSSPTRHDVAMAGLHAAPGCALTGRAYPSRPLSSSPRPASPPSRTYKKGHRPPFSRAGRPPMPLPPASSAHRGTTPSAPPRLQ